MTTGGLAIEAARAPIRADRPGRRSNLSTGRRNAPRWAAGEAKFNIVDSCFLAHPDVPAIVHRQESGEARRVGCFCTPKAGDADGKRTTRVRRLDLFRNYGRRGRPSAVVEWPMAGSGRAVKRSIGRSNRAGIIGCGPAAVVVGHIRRTAFRALRRRSRPRLANLRLAVRGSFHARRWFASRAGKDEPSASTKTHRRSRRRPPPSFCRPHRRISFGRSRFETRDFDWVAIQEAPGAPGEDRPFAAPDDPESNILFSSGTTGDPKAIPWTADDSDQVAPPTPTSHMKRQAWRPSSSGPTNLRLDG